MPKTPDPSMDMAQLLRLAQTDAGKQLISMLRGQTALQDAMEQASKGDYRLLQATVKQLLTTPEARALAESLRRSQHG